MGKIKCYTRFELSQDKEDLAKVNPTKIRALERELSDKGLVALKDLNGTNGAQDNLIVGEGVSSSKFFKEIVVDLDLPYCEKEHYSS